MTWMVIGAKGMLGQDLMAQLAKAGIEGIGTDKDDIDITNVESVATIADVDVIVNAAAYTAVDAAEDDEATAFTVNAVGPQLLARRAKEIGARLVHISTDYVFDGAGTSPYPADGPMAPKSAYGRTKAAGEWAVRAATDNYLILRTAWLYGAGGGCFPKTMARLVTERDSLAVVTDEIGQPTWTVDLADLIIRLVLADVPSGTYHGTSSGETSWHGFTQQIVASIGKDPAMVGETTAAAFNRPAPRPSYSVLGHDELRQVGITPIGDWSERWAEAAPVVVAEYR